MGQAEKSLRRKGLWRGKVEWTPGDGLAGPSRVDREDWLGEGWLLGSGKSGVMPLGINQAEALV